MFVTALHRRQNHILDDWLNLWYFTTENGSAIDGSDQRGSADLNITGSLSISTVDGDYCVTKAADSDEMNISLADLEVDLTDSVEAAGCTFVLAYSTQIYQGRNLFCHNGNGVASGIGTYQRTTVDGRVYIYQYNDGTINLGRGAPGDGNKGLMAWSNLYGSDIIVVNNGITTLESTQGNSRLDSDMTTMVFDSLSGNAASSYTYWAGLVDKVLTTTEVETLFSDWDNGGAGWRPGRS